MRLGTATPTFRLGTATPSRIYLGATQVWPTGGTDPDAADYFARIVAAGSSISSANQAAVSAFVVGCKADGIWSAIKASCILAGADTLAGALVPLVGPAPTNVSGNFVSGDYSRTTGLVGDGSTKYLDTNLAMTSLTSNSILAAVGVTTPHTTVGVPGAHFGGGLPGTDTCINCIRTTGNIDDFFNRTQSVTGDFVTGRGQHVGPIIVTRQNGSEWKIRSNGTESIITRASTALNSKTIFVFANNTGSAATLSVGRYYFYAFGDFANGSLLDARLTTLMSSLT